MGEETEDIHFYVLANGHGENILRVANLQLQGPPDTFLQAYWDRPIVAFMEMRQNFWTFQPDSWITYHVCTILEVDVPGSDKLFILVERVDDRLEIMLGKGYIPRSFMMEFRATGRSRRSDRCVQKPRQVVAPRVTVRRFFEWLGSNMSKRWQPYHILESNCQHVAEDVQSFIVDPNRDFESPKIDHTLRPVQNGCFARSNSFGELNFAAQQARAGHQTPLQMPPQAAPSVFGGLVQHQVFPQAASFHNALPHHLPPQVSSRQQPIIKLKNVPQGQQIDDEGCSIQ